MAKEASIRGKVYIQFVVEKDGSITDVKIIRGLGSGLDEIAKKAVRKMPKWEPGEQRGKPVRVRFVLPVNFTLR
jgi:protein TonB